MQVVMQRISPPEALLAALLIIATKLYYPFPPAPQGSALAETDLSLLSLSWTDWSKAHQATKSQENSKNGFAPGQQTFVSEEDVFSFSNEQMDKYMDWYTDAFLPGPEEDLQKNGGHTYSKALLDMFPIKYNPDGPPHKTGLSREINAGVSEISLDSIKERISMVMQTLQIRKVRASGNAKDDTEASDLPLGGMYQTFVRKERLAGIATVFHEKVAKQADMTVDALVFLVRSMEWHLKDMDKKRRVPKTKNESADHMDISDQAMSE